MKKRITAVITIIVMVILTAFTALAAEPDGSADTEGLKEEYKQANVIVDIYCLGLYNGSGYENTDAYKDLEIPAVLDESNIDEFAQRALQATLDVEKKEAKTVPAYPGDELDVKRSDVLLGLYLVLPHGSDLTVAEYLKQIKDDAGNSKYVTIAQTDKNEYRFSPIIVAMDYEHPDIAYKVKAEKKDRYGKIRIEKEALRYDDSHPATFVFSIKGTDPDDPDAGVVFDDVASITLDGTGFGYYERDDIPVGLMIEVQEIYRGSDLEYVSGDTGPKLLESSDDPEANKLVFKFQNTWTPHEDKGFGFLNIFRFEENEAGEKGWQWYQNVLPKKNLES